MVKRVKISKDIKIMALGGASGVILPVVLTNYVDVDPITFPPLFEGPWAKYSTLIPLVAGGLSLGLAVFTNVIKKPNTRKFLGMFGVVSLTSGLLSGLFATPAARFRAPARAQVARQQVRRNAGYYGVPAGGATPTFVTGQTVYA